MKREEGSRRIEGEAENRGGGGGWKGRRMGDEEDKWGRE
jgi:hypothetical protein